MGAVPFTGIGVMDVPAPGWIAGDEGLFSYWGMSLMTLIRLGTIRTIRQGETLPLADQDLSLMIDGGLYALEEGADDTRSLFVSFLRRGDLFRPRGGPLRPYKFVAHCRSTVLVVSGQDLDMLRQELAIADRLLHSLELHQTQQYASSLHTAGLRDKDRILRVLTMLASHPTASDTHLGMEIESGKQNIRDLAGVEKRSASRAFKQLADDGIVTFYGYKRLFFTGAPG